MFIRIGADVLLNLSHVSLIEPSGGKKGTYTAHITAGGRDRAFELDQEEFDRLCRLARTDNQAGH